MPLPPEQISIETRIEQLLERLSETEACGFEDLFDDAASRGDLIVTFLALLEMIRLKLVRVFQQGAGADSHLQAGAAEGRAAPDPRSRGRVQGAPSAPAAGTPAPARRDEPRRRRARRTPRGRTGMSDRDARPDADPATPRPAEADAAARPRLDAGQLKAIVEALVFASPEPLTPKMLFKLLADEPKEDVQAALDALMADYERPGGLHLAEVAGGYQITTRPELHDWVRRLFHERSASKLSVAALETLSVIAYRQPVTAAEVDEIRGVNTSGVLSTLLERHLIKIVGRKNVVGRPFLYGTTKEFLIRFGLKDLDRSAEDRGHGRRRSASTRRRC